MQQFAHTWATKTAWVILLLYPHVGLRDGRDKVATFDVALVLSVGDPQLGPGIQPLYPRVSRHDCTGPP